MLRHDPHGWWLAEAGPIEPRPPLEGDRRADVVVIGGGYTGLWTAWWLRRHAPELDVVVLEAETCGSGPSGRNGGFVDSHWHSLHELRRRFGDAPALAFARATEDSVHAIGHWCEVEGVDAWYRLGGQLVVSTAPAQDGAGLAAARACAELGESARMVPLDEAAVRALCDLPAFRAGVFVPGVATIQPARLAHGLRARLLDRGVTIHEHTRVQALRALPGGGVEVRSDGGGSVRARAAVLAINAAAGALAPLRNRLTVTSSHIVLTEPVPDVLDAIGWTGGEAILDGRTLLHYFRTTPDGRIAFGWGGGRIACGARLGGRSEVDPSVVAQARRDLLVLFPMLAGRRIEHAWGGPIDVSPTHLPVVGSLPGGPVHYAIGFTGNGVGPSELAGRTLAALALDRRDDVTRLAFVEPPAVTVPPEPLRWLGGSLVRAAYLRKERFDQDGRAVDPLTRVVCDIPRRLGVHLAR
jgi:glycine/D-amino acid oxidase-like deaminating enzyme